jgi:hypothetical protein
MEWQKLLTFFIFLSYVTLFTFYLNNRNSDDFYEDSLCDSFEEYDRCVNICPTVPGSDNELKKKLIEDLSEFDNDSKINLLRMEVKCQIHEKRITDKMKDYSIRRVSFQTFFD